MIASTNEHRRRDEHDDDVAQVPPLRLVGQDRLASCRRTARRRRPCRRSPRWNMSTIGVIGFSSATQLWSPSFAGDELVRVDDRRHPEPREQHELEEVAGVAQVHVDRPSRMPSAAVSTKRDHERRDDEPARSAHGGVVPHDRRARRRARAPAGRSARARRRRTRAAGSRAGTTPSSRGRPLATIDPVAGGERRRRRGSTRAGPRAGRSGTRGCRCRGSPGRPSRRRRGTAAG